MFFSAGVGGGLTSQILDPRKMFYSAVKCVFFGGGLGGGGSGRGGGEIQACEASRTPSMTIHVCFHLVRCVSYNMCRL